MTELNKLSLKQLQEIAREKRLKGFSTMRKPELLELVKKSYSNSRSASPTRATPPSSPKRKTTPQRRTRRSRSRVREKPASPKRKTTPSSSPKRKTTPQRRTRRSRSPQRKPRRSQQSPRRPTPPQSPRRPTPPKRKDVCYEGHTYSKLLSMKKEDLVELLTKSQINMTERSSVTKPLIAEYLCSKENCDLDVDCSSNKVCDIQAKLCVNDKFSKDKKIVKYIDFIGSEETINKIKDEISVKQKEYNESLKSSEAEELEEEREEELEEEREEEREEELEEELEEKPKEGDEIHEAADYDDLYEEDIVHEKMDDIEQILNEIQENRDDVNINQLSVVQKSVLKCLGLLSS